MTPMSTESTTRPRVLSGIQPTADSFHLGNYLGAIRQWVPLQDTHDAFYCVVNQHAITMGHDPARLRERTYASVAQLLAAGVDPERCTLFVQSHLAEHSQLAWVLSCITGYGEASRMTQFKDKSSRQGAEHVTVGLFNYPILQAADILLYQADEVPVGEDQRQHIELTRDLGARFNTRFGHTFTIPGPYILKETGKVLDLQIVDKQMSKSIGGHGCLWLLDHPAVAAKKIRTAVTDTGREIVYDEVAKPGISNLLRIYSALTGRSIGELEQSYAGKGYGEFKTDLAEVVVGFIRPFRERTLALLDDRETLDAILASGADRARSVASETLAKVYERIGFVPTKR